MRLRPAESTNEFQASYGYIVRLCLKKLCIHPNVLLLLFVVAVVVVVVIDRKWYS